MDMNNSKALVPFDPNATGLVPVGSSGINTIPGTASALALLSMIEEVMQEANQKLATMQTEVKGKMASAEFASMANTKQKANDSAAESRSAAMWSMVAGIVGAVLTVGSAIGGYSATTRVGGEALGTAINGVGGGASKLGETLLGIGASNADQNSKTDQADAAYLEKMTGQLDQYARDNGDAASKYNHNIQELIAKIGDLKAQIIAASKVNT